MEAFLQVGSLVTHAFAPISLELAAQLTVVILVWVPCLPRSCLDSFVGFPFVLWLLGSC